jgi:hypothetical protein
MADNVVLIVWHSRDDADADVNQQTIQLMQKRYGPCGAKNQEVT